MIKKLIPFILVAIIVGGGAFFGGMKYGGSKKSVGGNFPGMNNLSAEERQQRFQQMGGTARNGSGQGGGGSVNGEILSKDEKSITVKIRDGGSKIVFFADTTEIGKFTSGAESDLEIGKSVSVIGKVNSDGSVTAQSIQIRPAMTTNSPQPTIKK